MCKILFTICCLYFEKRTSFHIILNSLQTELNWKDITIHYNEQLNDKNIINNIFIKLSKIFKTYLITLHIIYYQTVPKGLIMTIIMSSEELVLKKAQVWRGLFVKSYWWAMHLLSSQHILFTWPDFKTYILML